MLQRWCRPSLLVRWLFLLLLPCAGFAWAIGFSAVNSVHATPAKHSLRHRSLFVSLSQRSFNCSRPAAPGHIEQPFLLCMIVSMLRGRRSPRSGQQPLQLQTVRKEGASCCTSPSQKSSSSSSITPTRQKPVVSQLSERRRLNGCTDRDINISQSRDIQAGGAPQFVVQIYSTCVGQCAPSDIHVNCGWFASKVVVNPGVFRRVAYDDCLVNAGRPILQGQILRFTYQNSFMYPITFKSALFC